MRRLWVITVLTAALGASIVATPGAVTTPYWSNCGVYGLSGDLLVHEVSCAKGTKVVGGFLAKAQKKGANAVVHGFTCHGKTPGNQMAVTCRKGVKRVHWRGTIS